MRPRRIRRGERMLDGADRRSVTALQCGHGEFAVENADDASARCRRHQCFNAATANSPWRTGMPRAAMPTCTCFNAATAMSPWRTPARGRARRCRRRLQCGHGDSPWRTYDRPVVASDAAAQLQCGHGDSPWRTPARACRHGARLGSASMRPRRFAVENELIGADCMLTTQALQCGHGDSPWRTSTAQSATRPRPGSFNAATAIRRGEPTVDRGRRRAPTRLQCGHGDSPWRTMHGRV